MSRLLTNFFMPLNLAEEHKRLARYTIHSYLIMGMSCFFLMFLNLYLELELLTVITGLLVIGALLSLFLVKYSYRITSIAIAQLQIVISLFIVGFSYSAATMIHVYLLPLFICLLVSLSKSERKFAYLYISIVLVCTLWVFTTGIRFFEYNLSAEMLRIQSCLNLLVSAAITLYYIITLLSINDAQLVELEVQNKHLHTQNIILDESIHSRDRLVSVLSHDLRSPLASVIMTMEMMLKEDVDVHKLNKFLKRLHNNCNSTLQMLDEVLDWIRNQNESTEFNPVTWCDEHFERNVLVPARDIAMSKKINIVFENTSTREVIADMRMLNCIVRNLLTNAIKFSYQNGTIHVGIEDTNEGARLFVRDYGKGMNKEEINSIMRGKSFTTKGTENEKGIGLGMMLVREFIARHGSALSINSEPGKGSEFHFTLASAGN